MAIAPFYSAQTRKQFLLDAQAALDAAPETAETPNERTDNDDP